MTVYALQDPFKWRRPTDGQKSKPRRTIDENKLRAAIAAYDQRIAENPDDATAYANRAAAHDKLGNHAAAIDNYGQVIRIIPTGGAAYANRALQYIKTRQWKEAVDDYRQTFTLAEQFRSPPQLSGMLANRGMAFSQMGAYRDAFKDFAHAIELDPTNIDAYLNRAFTRQATGDNAAAIDDCKAVIELNPNIANAYIVRANSNFHLENHEAVLADLHKACDIDPDNNTIHQRNLGIEHTKLATIYLHSGDKAAAIDSCNRAIEHAPDYAPAYETRAIARAETNEFARAIEDFSRAIDLDPSNPTYFIGRGMAQQDIGHLREALQDFRNAVKLNPNPAQTVILRSAVERIELALPADPKAIETLQTGLLRGKTGSATAVEAPPVRAIQQEENAAKHPTTKRMGRPATGRDPMLGVRMDEQLQKRGRARAEELGISFAQFVASAVRDALDGTSTVSELRPNPKLIKSKIKNAVLRAINEATPSQ